MTWSAVLCFLTVIIFMVTTSSGSSLDDPTHERALEFHFHIYFFQDNNMSRQTAVEFIAEVRRLQANMDTFVGIPLHINLAPRGPHPIGSCEIWCPREYFARAYAWFVAMRGSLSVLVHPLTRHEIMDHTERAAWIGPSVPLDLSALTPVLDRVPLQYPELRLGYSAPDAPQNS